MIDFTKLTYRTELVDVRDGRTWRVNGKCRTWKRQPGKFLLPIKHGLYTHSYINETNQHIFTLKAK